MSLDITDLFCGAGGSGLGAHAAGFELVMAANHWQRAIETHAANFPNTEHDCADISQVNPRRYRRTRVLWASPECTNHSQAKGKSRVGQSQPDLFGDTLPDEAAERSRATMWDVPRFAEVHRYDAVVVENVVEAAKWVMFPAWLMAMQALGYDHQLVFLNSMHAEAIAAPRAPQSRDRLYVVFHRKGARRPDVTLRPLAWCVPCGQQVRAVQSWKRPDRPWGRYRAQYVYRCPNHSCRLSVVEPYALPAAAAIDWNLPGQRIGDRAKPLSPKTIARIEAGLRKYGRQPYLTVNREGVRNLPVHAAPVPTVVAAPNAIGLVVPVEGREDVHARLASSPMRTQTARLQDALVVPSGGTWREGATSAGEPFATVTTRETDALVVPDGAFLTQFRERVRDLDPAAEPMPTVVADGANHALVVPYYGTAESASSADEPIGTLTTKDRYGVAFVAELRGGWSQARDVAEPLSTVTASGNHHMLVQGPGSDPAHPNSPRCGEVTRRDIFHGRWCACEPPVPSTPHSAVPPVDLLVDDCTFRMLEPAEIQLAMAFGAEYEVLGNRREKVRQLGNGVTPPAAEFLLRAVAESLDGAA